MILLIPTCLEGLTPPKGVEGLLTSPEQVTGSEFYPSNYTEAIDQQGQASAVIGGETQTVGGAFTEAQKKGLSEIRRVESGPYGYEAYNLGGKTEFDPVGSGSAKDGRFGKPLTQMTIGEIDTLGSGRKNSCHGCLSVHP